ncbi:SDR family NAD(P)-dependent oxidoreductase [Chitinimonas arctica]|uniref:SDR family NAD(P)-dependent oxidoreductase n=1 Tax=Chitinimonas arctica TaxID=2594795 RepID=A0A516SFR0_9NEIS|nr:oxidoreductase [Chitinimonas arctica]QDQ26993.1 SDR family NAD(P)-dependent oxidoreductase [Chitinimonas arctica]
MSKTWFITGAGRGIGAEIARAVLANGDQLVATGRNRAQLDKVFAEFGGQTLALELDVTQADQAHAAVAAALDRFGRIDVLVNNAGYGQLGLFEEVDADAIERQFATNVFGTMHVCRAVLPVMRRQRSGRVFNFSSMGGVLGFAGASIYCASKFAVEGYSESLAAELAPFGIHLTLVEPGFVRTDFLDASSVRYGSHAIADYAQASANIRTTFDRYNHHQPGDPAKLAAALLKLAEEAEPPLRFVAGADAVEAILGSLAQQREEVERWLAFAAI